MATNNKYYAVKAGIAKRLNDTSTLYITRTGMYIMDSRTINRVLQPGETIDDLPDCQPLQRDEALTLIAQNGYKHDNENK